MTRRSALGGKASDREEPAMAAPQTWLPAMIGAPTAERQTQRTDTRRRRPGSIVVAVHSGGPAASPHHCRNTLAFERKAFAHRHLLQSRLVGRCKQDEPCRQARIGTTTRSGHRDNWLTPRRRLRTPPMAQRYAPPTSRPGAARPAALRRDRLRVGADRLRWRLLGPAPQDCWPTAPRRKRLQSPPSSAAGSRPKPSGQLRQ